MYNSSDKQQQNSQAINKLDKAYLRVKQNIKSGKFISLNSATDINKHIEELKANNE